VRVELHLEARAELRAAALWYDERRPGLGDELIEEVTSLVERIREAPALFHVWPGTSATRATIQRAVVNRFPYVIAFEIHGDHILVLAIAHTRRRPLYWLVRAT
jgi:plasmid stabilization system protein ParE